MCLLDAGLISKALFMYWLAAYHVLYDVEVQKCSPSPCWGEKWPERGVWELMNSHNDIYGDMCPNSWTFFVVAVVVNFFFYSFFFVA